MSVDTLPEDTAPAPDEPIARLGRRQWVAISLVFVLVVGLVGAWFLRPGRADDVRSGTTLVTTDGLAARYGIDITLIGVTAAGGMVDFRYQVTDTDKADLVIHDLDLFPKIVEEDTGATLVMRSLPHSHNQKLELGGNYFFLLPNGNNALHPGSSVTLVIGDVRVEHMIVQG